MPGLRVLRYLESTRIHLLNWPERANPADCDLEDRHGTLPGGLESELGVVAKHDTDDRSPNPWSRPPATQGPGAREKPSGSPGPSPIRISYRSFASLRPVTRIRRPVARALTLFPTIGDHLEQIVPVEFDHTGSTSSIISTSCPSRTTAERAASSRTTSTARARGPS